MKKVIYIVLLALVPMASFAATRIGGQGLYNKAKIQKEINSAIQDITTTANTTFEKVKIPFMNLTNPLSTVTVDELRGLVHALNSYARGGTKKYGMGGLPPLGALNGIYNSVKNDYRADCNKR